MLAWGLAVLTGAAFFHGVEDPSQAMDAGTDLRLGVTFGNACGLQKPVNWLVYP